MTIHRLHRLVRTRNVHLNGRDYLKYSGAHLRALRALRGVGRPVKK